MVPVGSEVRTRGVGDADRATNKVAQMNVSVRGFIPLGVGR